LSKLARTIDALADKDEALLAREREVAALRGTAAAELHAVCAAFIQAVNGLLTRTRIALDPPEFGGFREDEPNLLQIHVRGRILQLEFRSTAEPVSTEEFRVPYILVGSVRSFNQQLLEQNVIREHLLFYCLEKDRSFWRYFDERTYRSGPFDLDYLAALLQELL
jgi:hypothetical protein